MQAELYEIPPALTRSVEGLPQGDYHLSTKVASPRTSDIAANAGGFPHRR